MEERKKTSFLMGELSKKKHNASTAMRVSLDTDLMRTSVDAEESQVVSSSGEKKLADKTCGKTGRTLCMTYNLFYYIRRALADVTNQGKEVMDTREGQSLSTPATAEGVSEGVSEPSILVKACQCIESNGKVLTEEAKMHITSITVKYSYTGHPRIASSSCRAKSWELNYPAISFMHGGYYADYASIMGTMGLSTMHHSTWDNLVSWVGPLVDRLANWSCKQVRADIEKCGDHPQ